MACTTGSGRAAHCFSTNLDGMALFASADSTTPLPRRRGHATSGLMTAVVRLILALIVLTSGCNRATPSSYYPLVEGMTWEYRVTVPSLFGGTSSGEMTVRNMAPRKLAGTTVIPQQTTFSEGVGFSFLYADAGGLTLHGSQAAGAVDVELFPEPVSILMFPLKPGRTWASESRSLLVSPDARVSTIATVEEQDASVTVEAGTFDSCIIVTARGDAPYSPSRTRGALRLHLESKAWYCQGVGLVQAVQDEHRSDNPNHRQRVSFSLMRHTAP